MTITLILAGAVLIGQNAMRYVGLILPTSSVERGDAATYNLVVGGINFEMPTDYLRFAEQHRDGILPSIDLTLSWPNLEPLGEAGVFQTSHYDATIFISVMEGNGILDTTELLSSVYREVFVGPVEHTAHGLIRRKLDEDAGYKDETVVFDISRGTGFAARCSSGGATVWETCYRDVLLTNGLAVKYRFSPELLTDWEALDAALLNLLLQFAQAGETQEAELR